MKVLKIAVVSILIAVVVAIAIFGVYFYRIFEGAKEIDISFDNNLDKFVFLQFYDKDNAFAPLAGMDFCESCDIPDYVFSAFIAKEDKRFLSHSGVDYRGILRASVANFKSKKAVQGGSTITQQLAKNLVLSSEKKLSRKISEVALALEIEQRYSKEEILTMYLNVIYFGENTFGITNASKLYFGKKPSELTISESAMLAGIIASPENYSPVKSIEIATAKRDIVLELMKDQGYISESEFEGAINEKINLKITKNTNINYDYFNHALKESAEVLGISEGELSKKNYKIYTYIDLEKQGELQNLGKNETSSDCVLIALSNDSSGVSAVFESCHDLIYAKRSPASLIKPLLVYAPAIEENVIFENSIIQDEVTDFSGYQPKNYLNIYYGDVTAKTALAKSLNVPSVKILDSLTPQKARLYASKLGMNLTNEDRGLAIALGGLSKGMSPLEISAGYLCLASGGEFSAPSFVREIQDGSGNIIYSRNVEKTRVFGDDTAFIITDMLKECTSCGTGKDLCEISPFIASKTGTNGDENGNFDAYTCGYTTCDTFFCWLGNRDYSYMPMDIKGSTSPVQNAKAYFGERGEICDFEMPKSVSVLTYDRDEYLKNGKLLQATSDTPKNYVGKTLISSRYYPISKSLKYSYPRVLSPSIMQCDDFLEILVTTQEFAKYQIFDRNSDELVAEFLGDGSEVSTVLPAEGESVRFEILAINAESGKVGERYTFEKLYLKKNFMPAPKESEKSGLKGKDMPLTDSEILDFFS